MRHRSSDSPQAIERVWLVYDGECPLCSHYAEYIRLSRSVGEFILVDARRGGPIVEEIRRLAHDLNDGMVVKVGERFYIGHEALNVLALLCDSRGVFNRTNRWLFGSPRAARLSYRWLRFARRMALKFKGAAPIGDASTPSDGSTSC